MQYTFRETMFTKRKRVHLQKKGTPYKNLHFHKKATSYREFDGAVIQKRRRLRTKVGTPVSAFAPFHTIRVLNSTSSRNDNVDPNRLR